MIKKILKMGNPLLLQQSKLVADSEFNTTSMLGLIEDLVDTKRHFGGVGIAAPQIGVSKQLMIIEYYQRDITRYTDIGDCSLKIIINPQFEIIGNGKTIFNEGCLSLPGLRGQVSRPTSIAYEYYDQFGNKHTGADAGFFARVFQHEYDHLSGILYPMRMDDISTLGFVNVD